MWKPRVIETALIIAAILAFIGIAIPLSTRWRDNDNRLKCLENLRVIGAAVKQWSLDHDFAIPPGRGMSGFCDSQDGKPQKGNLYTVEPGLNALWNKGNGVIKDVNIFRCPGDRTLEPPPQPGEDFTSPRQLSYGMTGNIYPTDLPNKVIVADKSDKSLPDGPTQNTGNHGHQYTNVLFFDGTVRTFDHPYLPPGSGSELGSIYIKETGNKNDTYIE